MIDYYDILEIYRTADKIAIKKAYRQKALYWHPDKNKSPNAHSEFIKINEAYNILIDDSKKAVYDKLYDEQIRYNNDVSVTEQAAKYKQYKTWVDEEREKAAKLASLSFDQFLKGLSKVVEKSVNAAYFGCSFYIAIVIIIAGLVSFFEALGQVAAGEIAGWVFILQLIWSSLFILAGGYWIRNMLKKKF